VSPNLLKRISDGLAHVPGLPILLGVGLIGVNLVCRFLPAWPVVIWLAKTDLLLHVGLALALIGVLLGDAL
jgi:hypothetical protein